MLRRLLWTFSPASSSDEEGAAEGAEAAAALPKPKVKFAGLTQHSQADTHASSSTENPYKSLRVDPDSGSTL